MYQVVSLSHLLQLVVMQPADTVRPNAASQIPDLNCSLVPTLGADANVQPTDKSHAGRQTCWVALQEPNRLSMEDTQNGGTLWLVQRCVTLAPIRNYDPTPVAGSTAHFLRIAPHT